MPSSGGYALFSRHNSPRGTNEAIAENLPSLSSVAAAIQERRHRYPTEAPPAQYEPPGWLHGRDYSTDDGYRIRGRFLSWTVSHDDRPGELGSAEFLFQAVDLVEDVRARQLGFSSAAHRETATRLARLEAVLSRWGLALGAATEEADADDDFSEAVAKGGVGRLAAELRSAVTKFEGGPDFVSLPA